jgi:hypothetical protein
VKSEVENMRYFTFDGPLSLNGYAEVPENAPTDYLDSVYQDVYVWWGLTFGGFGIVRGGELIAVCNAELKWRIDNSKVTAESIEHYCSKYQDGDEVIKIIGFDDSHINRCPIPIIEEAKNLAEQIDTIFGVAS